jgi:TonB family protein
VTSSTDAVIGRRVGLSFGLHMRDAACFAARRVILVTLLSFLPQFASGAHAQEIHLNDWLLVRLGVKAENKDGAIRLSGGGGWIRTTPAFLDFVLRMQFRSATVDASGAVLIRVYPLRPGEDPGVGYRIALPMAGGTQVGLITAYEGNIQDLDSPIPIAAKPAGEWRDLEVRAEGTRITISIDGAVVRTAKSSEAWAGYVGLERRAGVMEFRNVRLERLPAGRLCESDSWSDASVLTASKENGVAPPRLRKSISSRYTPDAMRNGKHGVVRLEGVVLADGTVGDVCVRQPLDPDLDIQAVAAAKQFQFFPGTRNGEPVAVRVAFEIKFTLQ